MNINVFRREKVDISLTLEKAWQLKVSEWNRLWKNYKGKFWEGDVAGKGETGKKSKFNYVKRFENKLISFLVGKGVRRKYKNVSTKDIELFEEVCLKKEAKSLLSLAQIGGVTGDVYILLMDEGDRVGMEILDPRDVIPRKVSKQEVLEADIVLSEDRSRKVQRLTADKIEEYDGKVNVKSEINPWGEIPLVHIPNIIVGREYWGTNDLDDGLIEGTLDLNNGVSMMNDRVDYFQAPIIIGKGVSAKKLSLAKGSIWGGLSPDADVSVLDLVGDLSAMAGYVKMIKEILYEVVGVPEGSLGRIQAISNTSAAALQMQYQPLIEVTWFKRLSYGPGLEKAYEKMFRMFMQLRKKKVPKDFSIEVKFNSPFPKDEKNLLDTAEQKQRMGIESKRGVLEDLGVRNPDKKLKEIEDERLKEEGLEGAISGAGVGA